MLTKLKNSSVDTNLLGVGFSDLHYTFVYRKENSIHSAVGKIFFDSFFKENHPLSYPLSNGEESPAPSSHPLFVTSVGAIYLGLGYDVLTATSDSPSGLFRLYLRSADEGSGSFQYRNNDIDGLTGFSFEVEPAHIKAVDFGFSLKTNTGEYEQFSLSRRSVQELDSELEEGTFSHDDYSISRDYNYETRRHSFHIELTALQSASFFSFDFSLRSINGISSAIHSMEVFKKVPAKIAEKPGEGHCSAHQGLRLRQDGKGCLHQ